MRSKLLLLGLIFLSAGRGPAANASCLEVIKGVKLDVNVANIEWSKNGSFLAAGDTSRLLVWLDFRNLELPVKREVTLSSHPYAFKVSSDGTKVAVLTSATSGVLWNSKGLPRNLSNEELNYLYQPTWTKSVKDGNLLLSDTQTGSVFFKTALDPVYVRTGLVPNIRVSRDHGAVMIDQYPEDLLFSKADAGWQKTKTLANAGRFLETLWSDDLSTRAVFSTRSQQSIWVEGLRGNENRETFRIDSPYSAVALSSDGKLVSLARPDGKIEIWSFLERKLLATYTLDTPEPLTKLWISEDGSRVMGYSYSSKKFYVLVL